MDVVQGVSKENRALNALARTFTSILKRIYRTITDNIQIDKGEEQTCMDIEDDINAKRDRNEDGEDLLS